MILQMVRKINNTQEVLTECLPIEMDFLTNLSNSEYFQIAIITTFKDYNVLDHVKSHKFNKFFDIA